MQWDVRITVLKRTLNQDAVERYAQGQSGLCDRFAEGQTFVVAGRDLSSAMPAGFCSWAWADIHQFVLALARGANFIGAKPGTFVTCCTDGFRPVVFAVERVEADDGV
jgi:uncharacterized repeat protein (TIGR04076 family)